MAHSSSQTRQAVLQWRSSAGVATVYGVVGCVITSRLRRWGVEDGVNFLEEGGGVQVAEGTTDYAGEVHVIHCSLRSRNQTIRTGRKVLGTCLHSHCPQVVMLIWKYESRWWPMTSWKWFFSRFPVSPATRYSKLLWYAVLLASV